MPINPNIALGVRPMEQPNMLAQMGQMMQLRQMQQGFESENALRDFYAKGGDLSTAEGKREIMSRAPAAGMKLIGQQSEISARDIGTAEKSLAMLKNQAGFVKTPQDAANWLSSFYKNPLTRPYVEAVAPMDQALAAIPTDPAALQGWLRNASLKADQIFESADAQLRAKVDREGHGVQIRGQNMTDARAREQLEFERNKRNVIASEGGYSTTDPYGNIYRVEGYGAMRGPNAAPAAAPALPPAAANAFVTTRPPVNNLGQTPPVVQPGSPTVANAAAIAQQQNIPRPPVQTPTLTEVDDPANPGQKLRVDARIYKQGTTLGAPGVLGVARTEKLTPQQTVKLKAEMGSDFKILDNVTAQTNDLLKSIDMLRDPEITKGLKAITGYSGVLTPTFKDASQLAQTRLDNLRGKVIALGKASASMTGAIGSIANQEWKILADQIAAIDPKMGDKALLEQVQLVEDRALGVFERAKEQYGRQYGEYFETIGPQYSTMPKLKPRGVSSSGVDRSNPLLQ